jgi:hypothetical protein
MVNTGRKTIVNLLEKTCDCEGFQEYQSPCAYAIVAARYYNDDPYIYFGWWHTLNIYCATYCRVLLLTLLYNLKNNKSIWPSIERRKQERPKTSRIRRRDIASDARNCERCEEVGHNVRTCLRLGLVRRGERALE